MTVTQNALKPYFDVVTTRYGVIIISAIDTVLM